jgi:hypothetical protein
MKFAKNSLVARRPKISKFFNILFSKEKWPIQGDSTQKMSLLAKEVLYDC